MLRRIECLCGRSFYYPACLEMVEEGFAFNVYCEECERILAVIITREDRVVSEVTIPELVFDMPNMVIDDYGIFFYEKVDADFVKEKFKGKER